MPIITTVSDFKTWRETITGSVGFVATMGCLHEGHAALLNRCKKENDITVLSLFINPTQFNNAADFEHYPKTIEADLALAAQLNIDCVFMPDVAQMYPTGTLFQVTTHDPLAARYEGEFRPGHYQGVLTIVMKLFHLIRPQRAYFGEKDFQQCLLIQGMVDSFLMDIHIVVCPTVREASGLAFSSRNKRLNAEQKKRAEFFAKTLQNNSDIDLIKQTLAAQGIPVDYIAHEQGRLLAAAYIDGVRLIDTVNLTQVAQHEAQPLTHK